MELRQLEYFVAVVEEASFTKAAARVHVAQPGVSAQVRRLEAELGEPLLDRSGRSVRPTEAGAAVLPYARAALEAVSGARVAVEELTGLLRGRVAVGMVVACGVLDLPDLLAEFHRAHPRVEITLSEANSDELVDAVRGGRLDLGLIAFAGSATPAGVDTQVLVDEPIVAAVPHAHPLARRRRIPLRRLRDEPIVSLPVGTGLRTALDDAAAQAGFRPWIAFEASVPNVVAQLALRGLGVAILPASVAAAHAGALHALDVTGPEMRGGMALAWRAGGAAGPAARALVAHARAALAGGLGAPREAA
jgi:DNA-binding transcriptional LysR family regulator